MENELSLLKELLAKHDFEKFESILSNVVRDNDSKCISELITLFDDEFEFDEIMFSIIHAIESFDDDSYTKEIVVSSHLLQKKAPRWFTIILSRIRNNGETNKMYLINLNKTSKDSNF